MTTITAGSKTFELFSSIKELPITRYKRIHHYLLQETGIGSTVSDFDNHFGKTVSLLEGQKYDEATTELTNLRYSFFSTISELDFRSMAFACMINKVDGVQFDDLTAEGLASIVKILHETDISVQDLDNHWNGVKKKLIPSLALTSQDGSEMTLSTLKT